jgi:hypothetical protein
MDTIFGFFLENWPYAIWIAVGGAIVWLYLSLKNKAGRAEERAAEAHAKVNRLPCESHKEILDSQKDNNRDRDIRIEKMDIKIDYLGKNISDMAKNINSIADKLNVNIIRATPLTQSQSPIMLTDRGAEKVRELGIDKMISDNWEHITAIIEEKSQSKNPYDIQQICMDESMIFPEKFITPGDIDTLKLDAYKNGDILQSYMRMVAIIIRDRFFREHSIVVEDIDIYDPDKSK